MQERADSGKSHCERVLGSVVVVCILTGVQRMTVAFPLSGFEFLSKSKPRLVRESPPRKKTVSLGRVHIDKNLSVIAAKNSCIVHGWPNIVIRTILYIDAIGPNLRVHQKKTTHTVHCCLSQPSHRRLQQATGLAVEQNKTIDKPT